MPKVWAPYVTKAPGLSDLLCVYQKEKITMDHQTIQTGAILKRIPWILKMRWD